MLEKAIPTSWLIGGGVLIAVIAVGIGIGWLKIHDATVAARATAEFNQKQLEEVLKEQKANEQRWKNLLSQNAIILEQLSKVMKNSDEAAKKIEEILNDPEMQKHDRDSSKVLKETIRALGGR